MKAIMDSIRRALRDDAILDSLLGRDQDGEPKVYQGIVKTDVDAPYIVMTVVTGIAPEGVYGDDYSIQNVLVQVTAWGRNPSEAWQLAEMIPDAFDNADYAAEPWELARASRVSFPRELTDRDTSLIQVNADYAFMFTR